MRERLRWLGVLPLAVVVLQAFVHSGVAADQPAPSSDRIEVQRDIPYLAYESGDEYAGSQCMLDAYLPKASKDPFPLLVWLHGGALKGGSRRGSVSVQVAQSLAARGIGVILADYRLSPKVKFPVYIQDSAEAVRWAVENAGRLKAQPRIYVGGHSAGGYIAALLAMDGKFLKEAGVKPEQVAGFICMSGQMMTHFTVAEEKGISSKVITADEAAPIHHLRKDVSPMLILIGDNDWPARLEENAYFVSALRKVGESSNVSFMTIKDRTHESILKKTAEENDPAAVAIMKFTRTGVLPADGSEQVKP